MVDNFGLKNCIEENITLQFIFVNVTVGNFKKVNINNLHTGHTKSCGGLKNRIKDLTGQKFVRFTVCLLILKD